LTTPGEEAASSPGDAFISRTATGAAWITLRHGNFASLDEAESVRLEISRLGVPTEVVQVR